MKKLKKAAMAHKRDVEPMMIMMVLMSTAQAEHFIAAYRQEGQK
jgi:hypothetical protein